MRRRWLAGALAADALIFSVEALTSSDLVLAAVFVVPPLVVGLRSTVSDTTIVSIVSIALTLAAGLFFEGSRTSWIVAAALVPIACAVGLAIAIARRRLEREAFELEVLADVANVADGRMGLDETVRRLTDLIVPRLGDMCAIDAIEPSGELRRIAAAAHDNVPGGRAAGDALKRRRVVPVGSTQAARTGERVLLEVTDEIVQRIAASPEDLELLRAARIKQVVNLPLRSRGRLIGVLSLCLNEVSGRRINEDLVRFAEILAGRVALALDNAGLSAELSGVERRLDAILESLDEAVTVQMPDGRTTFANPAAIRLFGLEGTEEVVDDAEPGTLMALFDVFHPDGTTVSLDEFPSSRLLRGEPAEPMLVRNVIRATGESRWLDPARHAGLRRGRLARARGQRDRERHAGHPGRPRPAAARRGRADPRLLLRLRAHARGGRAARGPRVRRLVLVELPTAAGLQQVALAHVDPEQGRARSRAARALPAHSPGEGGVSRVLATGAAGARADDHGRRCSPRRRSTPSTSSCCGRSGARR